MTKSQSYHPIPKEGQPRPEEREHLARLPVLWEAVYGDRHGVLALFSGLRNDRRLMQPREVFYRYPHDVPAALSWVREHAERDRELYQCAHLLMRPRRRKADAAPLACLFADVDEGNLLIPGCPAIRPTH